MTPPRGPAGPPPRSAPLLRHVCRCLPGQDEAQQRGARAERGLEGASELLCGVWLPSGRREAPLEHSGKLLTNAPPDAAKAVRPPARQTGPRPSGTLEGNCRPSAFQILAGRGDQDGTAPLGAFPSSSPRPSSPLCHAAPGASVSPWGWAAPPWWGCQARLSSLWGAGGTREATGQGGCLTRTIGSRPGPNPYLTPRGARLAPAVPAAWSQACPRPAQPASPKPTRQAPCITMCPSPETSSPQGHPWASPRGLRDGHDPSEALNRSPGRRNTRLPEFGWGR